jgi:RNA polymerase sigma-70 factor (ECF subfamily)
MRDARREEPLPVESLFSPNSEALARQLIASSTTPSRAAQRAELVARLRDALEQLSAESRQVLSLRHYEQLTNAEIAAELGLSPSGASYRYAQAVLALREKLGDLSALGLE